MLHITSWNRACILKLLWALITKEDKLWIRWIHSYYIKEQNVLSMSIPSDASYLLKKVRKVRSLVVHSTVWQQQLEAARFSVSAIYHYSRQQWGKWSGGNVCLIIWLHLEHGLLYG